MVLPPLALALLGSSLTTGRLSADWVPRLTRELQAYPEAKGPIDIYNKGKGSQNSAWGVTQIPDLVALKPTHVLMEGFAINDCIDTGSGPAISRAQHITNIQTMVAGLQAGIPGVDITIQTMNPVSAAGSPTRPNLVDYYADEIATAAILGVRSIDNYASWPHPLPDFLSNGAAIGYSAFTGTWDPGNKNSHVTLSGGNLGAASSALNCGVKGTISRNAGLYYFDVLVTNETGLIVGIENAAATVADGHYVGLDVVGIGYGADGKIYSCTAIGNATSLLGLAATYAAGDLIGVAVNFTLHKVWFCKSGTWQNGDPVAGVGGFTIPTDTFFPAVSMSVGGSCTGNFINVYPGDGLHPLWSGGVDTYLYPNVITWARARMAALWP
jgi:hypothetical protein